MEAKELMIGDWVDEKFVGKHQWQLYDFKEFDDDWEKWISPISLTAEILEKNGFMTVDNKNFNLPVGYLGDGTFAPVADRMPILSCHVFYNICTGLLYITAHTEFGKLKKNVKYVHELQHALRICSLSDIADKFEL